MEIEGLEMPSGEPEAQAGSAGSPTPGTVRAEVDAQLNESLAATVAAGRDVAMTDSLCGVVVAGGSIAMTDCLDKVVVAGGNVEMHGGGVALMHCQQASVQQGTIGVLITPKAVLGEQVRVLMNDRQAVLMGVAFGLAAGLLRLLFRRKREKPRRG